MQPILILTALVFGQADFTLPGGSPHREERARRESCVARSGGACRALVEKYGSAACATLEALPPEAGARLAKFHDDEGNGLTRLPDPKGFLNACRKGADVADWGIAHAAELRDGDALSAWTADPERYSLGLRPLAEGAAEWRARRLRAPDAPGQIQAFAERNAIPIMVALFAGVVIIGWWRRRKPPTEIAARQ